MGSPHRLAPPMRAGRGQLLRLLGVSFGVAMAVGGIIGAGILRAPTSIAVLLPHGWAILLLWIAGAASAALGVNVVAELGTMIPRDGGTYAYAQRAFGDVAGLAVGWSTWMALSCGTAALAMSFSNFLATITPLSPREQTALAMGAELGLYALNAVGLREGVLLMKITSTLKALALLTFVALAFLVAPHLVAPTASLPVGAAPVGFAALIGGYQLIAGAYAGWGDPAAFTAENSDPGQALPKALYLGLLVSAGLYIAVIGALLWVLGAHGIAHTALPFAAVIGSFLGPSAGIIVAAVAMLIVLNCAHAQVMGAPRYIYAMAEDGLLPRLFCGVNAGGTPHWALVLSATCALALTVSGSFNLVFGLIATLNAAVGAIICAGFFVLRWREPELARPYRAFGYPWMPLLALGIEGTSFVLFMNADRLGALYAVGLWLLCIPLALIARRTGRGLRPRGA